jgi:SAM-dependent methyltransferase
MAYDNEIGREHQDEFASGFHDRLARHWPEPREQLHAGGWRATQRLVQELRVGSEDVVLDVCCGEGGSAVWMARTWGLRVYGIDLLLPAIEVAQQRAKREGVDAQCTFVCGNLFSLPFADESFTVVFGQDPDGFAHRQRGVAFQECFRVLRRGGRFGIQHWIPGLHAPQAITERFDRLNVEVGYPSHAHVHADAYVQAMQSASFQGVQVIDRSRLYREHMLAIRDRARQRREEIDTWTAMWLNLASQHPFGVILLGQKTR